MTNALHECMRAAPASERRALWRRRLARQWPLHGLKIASSLLCHVSFALMFLTLPVKIVTALCGVWAFFQWWMVPVGIAAGYLLGALADRLERMVLARFLAREFAPGQGAPPFATDDAPLDCPACGVRVMEARPRRGVVACRCGAILRVASDAVEVVAHEPPSKTPPENVS